MKGKTALNHNILFMLIVNLYFSCADGYYGIPTKLQSKCMKCSCNGGPCEQITGKCITCQ